MNRITIIIGMLVVIALALGAWWYFSRPAAPPEQPSSGVTFPSAGSAPATPTANQNGVAELRESNGDLLQVNNPTKDPMTFRDPYSPDFYYLGYHIQEGTTSDPTATKGAPYVIEYIDSTNYFDVVLLQEPLGTVRQEAEQYLIHHLGISEQQLCALKYTVGVPHWVSEQYTGIDLRFSFCPGAVTLPQ